MNEITVLVLAFNRPDYLSARLHELETNWNHEVNIFIDGGTDKNIRKTFNQLESTFSSSKYKWYYRYSNFGVVKNLFSALEKIFDKYDACIVIEDDVKVSASSLASMTKILTDGISNEYFTVGAFGGLPSFSTSLPKVFNPLRATPYFSAWGWGLKRNAWLQFENELASLDWDASKLDSPIWRKLNLHQREIWASRFKKLQSNVNFAWDYQFQYFSFKNNLLNLLPVFRSGDNVGFNDARSTNTKLPRPRWYLGKSVCGFSTRILVSYFLTRIIVFLDSLTWAGDHKILKLRKKWKEILDY